MDMICFSNVPDNRIGVVRCTLLPKVKLLNGASQQLLLFVRLPTYKIYEKLPNMMIEKIEVAVEEPKYDGGMFHRVKLVDWADYIGFF
jgi:hypothetical protein